MSDKELTVEEVLFKHATGDRWEVDDEDGDRMAVDCGQQVGGDCDWTGYVEEYPAHLLDALRDAGWVVVRAEDVRVVSESWVDDDHCPGGEVAVTAVRRLFNALPRPTS